MPGADTLTGAWMRQAVAVQPQYSTWSTVSGRHEAEEGMDPRRADAIAEAAPGIPSGPGEDFTPRPIGEGRADRTPVVHAGTPMHAGMTLEESYAVHSADMGAVEARTTALPRVVIRGDADPIIVQPDMDTPPNARGAGDRPDLTRGLNAFAANNPPQEMYGGRGWRQAEWIQQRGEHVLALPQRVHRFRVLVRTAAIVDKDTPGIDSVYGAPWSSLARFIPRNFARPRLRRVPPMIDEAIYADPVVADLEGAHVGAFV